MAFAKHSERRHAMSSISLRSRAFVVSAVVVVTAFVVAAFPLLALASDGNPSGI
jgi:hypothetical protein